MTTNDSITPPIIAASMPQHQKSVDALTAARGNVDALEAIVAKITSANSYAGKARAYGQLLILEAREGRVAPTSDADAKRARKVAQQRERREAARNAKVASAHV